MNNIDNKTTKLPLRASNNRSLIATIDRKKTIEKIMLSLLLEEISQGKALKILRLNILGLKQDAYAKLVNISRKTLSDIENDKGNYSIDIVNKAFKPFGLKIGLVPVTSHMLLSILKNHYQ
ncbi:TPA: helix-turn-helix transcriptional regulator [Proteus mirabilis]|uniref:helix-turn-helix transcriptional regulator n=1 Tax=Proteus mirabilis TaxID=584 RepID=UPI0034D4ABB6